MRSWALKIGVESVRSESPGQPGGLGLRVAVAYQGGVDRNRGNDMGHGPVICRPP